jgi:phosphoenolpyruvate synthase/pyruvate phosphate dikinase
MSSTYVAGLGTGTATTLETNPGTSPDTSPDRSVVGAKAGRLAELAREGIPVPEGFAVTAAAYQEFVLDARLGPVIAQAIRRFRAGRELAVAAAEIRSAFRDAPLPRAVADEIRAAYCDLGDDGASVAVRCSPRDETGGQSFLHLSSEAEILAACRRCFAALFDAVAVGNREALGADHLKAAMPVLVQRMIRSDLGGSGTVQRENTFLRVRASWGLAGASAAGSDQYSVHPGPRPLIMKHLGTKPEKVVYADPRGIRTVPTTSEERTALVLTDQELRELAGWSVVADRHFCRPMTLAWAKDGPSGRLFLMDVQPAAVPAPVIPAARRSVLEPEYA